MSKAGDNQSTAPVRPDPGDGLPTETKLIYALLAVLVVGIGVAVYLVRHKLLLQTGLLEQSSCNFGGAINCDKVNTSPYSSLFGLPIALYAVPTYGAMIYLVNVARTAMTSDDAEQRARLVRI